MSAAMPSRLSEAEVAAQRRRLLLAVSDYARWVALGKVGEDPLLSDGRETLRTAVYLRAQVERLVSLQLSLYREAQGRF